MSALFVHLAGYARDCPPRKTPPMKLAPSSRSNSSSAMIVTVAFPQNGSARAAAAAANGSAGYDAGADGATLRAPDTPNQGGTSLSRKESYKDQRRKYRCEKKRVARELLSTLKDPAVVVLADWLKVRGSLKGWTKLWCVLKPGMLLLYKSAKVKSSHWVGTVLLNTCELIERPSKKDGFCFKLFHPLEQSIWATKGPEGETMGAVVQPFPSSHLIFRAPSQAAGKCWMDALELAVRCSSILIRSMTSSSKADANNSITSSTLAADKWNESDYEKHFKDQDLDDASHTDENEHHRESGHFSGADAMSGTESESEDGSHKGDEEQREDEEYDREDEMTPTESAYVPNFEGEMGEAGEQVEELEEENKSLIWFLLKQVRPGMDLSKVVLPTFILEPRSFLDKLSDYYYHADLIPKAVQEDDPFTRMKEVVRWYLSGFYKKPKGLKKPYNPILGETFRCYWRHPNGSRTFYVAEQVSHHPPVSAVYVTNRQEGFSVTATVLAKSKFYGNSTSAILDGNVLLTLLPRGEDYVMNMPYAHCKGILMGTLTMELGGKVTIECEKTGYRTELEFKLRPFLSGYEANNMVSGKIKLGKDTLATLEGYWDGKISFTDKRKGEEEVLWHATPEVKMQRLQRFTVAMDQQGSFESEKLWQLVSLAIKNDDQVAATEEKTILEEAQRSEARERKAKCEEWVPKYFTQEPVSGVYVYKHSDLRPWDPRTDLFQYEFNYVISTKTRHKAPMIRTASIVSVDPKCEVVRKDGVQRLRGVLELAAAEETSSGDHDDLQDMPERPASTAPLPAKRQSHSLSPSILEALNKMLVTQDSLVTEMKGLRQDVDGLHRRLSAMDSPKHRAALRASTSQESASPLSTQSWASILVALIFYSLIQWLVEKIRS
ncbi:oxysterol-binding protein-related protein 8-like isoform X3 [Penaeus monodon]|uniref:oxysterol-binding protein-related protein 8-like isoform X3 n=1 Tax=Penaeus monodon TaxID=6687 RepID=UPI0018A6E93E|nr:oxysterol-binding protein-related protein 8-like isoform X3 [Penaeus monodon]